VRPSDSDRPTGGSPAEKKSSNRGSAPKDLYQALAALDGKPAPDATEDSEPPPEPSPEPPPEKPAEAAPEVPPRRFEKLELDVSPRDEPPPPLVREPSKVLGFLKILAAVVALAVIGWALLTLVLPSTDQAGEEPAPTPVASPTPEAAATRITEISWQQSAAGTTTVTIIGDGQLTPEQVQSAAAGDDRYLVKVLGISEQYQSLELAVATPQLVRIRTWLHEDRQPTELHIVLDLAGTGVQVAETARSGSLLTLELSPAP
jgi:hypothetical protein